MSCETGRGRGREAGREGGREAGREGGSALVVKLRHEGELGLLRCHLRVTEREARRESKRV